MEGDFFKHQDNPLRITKKVFRSELYDDFMANLGRKKEIGELHLANYETKTSVFD